MQKKVVSAIGVVVILLGVGTGATMANAKTSYDYREEILQEKIVEQSGEISGPNAPAQETVILTVTDKKDQTKVFVGTGDSIDSAWNMANKAASKSVMINRELIDVVQAERVMEIMEVPISELEEWLDYYEFKGNQYGISFTKDFSELYFRDMLIEQGIVDPKTGTASYDQFLLKWEQDLAAQGKTIPESVFVIQTEGFLVDRHERIIELPANEA